MAAPRPNEPQSLLGAYALHFYWERGFQFTRRSEHVLGLLGRAEHFDLDVFLKKTGLLDTPVGVSYESFWILETRSCDRDIIAASASYFPGNLVVALKAQG